ncbi:MAG: CapA family protein, partial [Oscillospiraceae bacterium]|nr:CapA family protein [Oscillospiraceae bacterium]
PAWVGIKPKPKEEPEPEPEDVGFDIVVSFTGDMMLASLKNETTASNFNAYAAQNEPSYFLQNVRPLFKADDLTVVNLENVLTDRKLVEKEKDHDPAYWYRSRTANTEILTSSGVEAVSLANNHTGDYGPDGIKDTIKAVEKAGLLYGNNSRTFYYEKNGYRIAVICHGLWNEGQAGEIVRRIRQAEEDSDFQIVFYHGGKEKVHEPEPWRQRASRRLVDEGADLVIGNHPHVLQPRETYQGVEIIYSMGNFCYGGSKYPENRTIIYQLKLHIDSEGKLESKAGEIIPCYVYTGDAGNNYCPGIIGDEETKQRVLDFMDGKRQSPL